MAAGEAAGRKLKVAILNQYYAPDVAATGQLLKELAEWLAADGVDVRVVASRPSYGPPETWQDCAAKAVEQGVAVRRLRTTRYPKDSLAGRLLNSLTFLGGLGVRALAGGRPDEIVLYCTNPPYLGALGWAVSLLRRHRYVVLLHDAYPQLAVLVGKLREGGVADRTWHRLNRLLYGRAAEIIVLCTEAKEMLCARYGIPERRIHVIHNWAAPEVFRPLPKRDSQFATQHDLREPFVLMYSGNLGLYYEYETLLDAADRLREQPFRLVFVGAGGKRDWLEREIADRDLTNALIFPYQPFERLRDSLGAADASLVTIAKGVEGLSFPSKLYTSLAMGRPVVAISEPRSELRDIVQGNAVGIWHAVGDGEGLAASLATLIEDPARCRAMGKRARALFEERFTLAAAGRKYRTVLEQARG